MSNRTDSTQFLSKDQILSEVDNLKFAFSSLVEVVGQKGSHEYEVAKNACRGIKWRLDYLHDSIERLIP